MTDRELLEYIAAQVGKLTQDFGELKVAEQEIDERLGRIENMVTRIEQDHGNKL
ncbi:MAG: hypothetical protein N2489_03335 [Clostridia bacterium]|nr:hypothetical protein [Clostridia bacterium]